MRALICGITGQDGSYMAELLLSKGYEVFGIVRRSSVKKFDRIEALIDEIKLVEGDLTDQSSLDSALQSVQPAEVYNFAAQSFVPVSWNQPVLTGDVTGLGVIRILEAIRRHCPRARFLQASSSEMFGKVRETPQTEKTPFHPRSPYGVAKLYGYWITVNYRDAYGIHASNGILFNHEGPTRGETFVTRKISRAVAAIRAGHQETLYLGNLDARRDWGHARDFVEGMWSIVQQDEPDDYVLATGEAHTVREFVEEAFAQTGCQMEWRGSGRDEHGVDPKSGKTLVAIDPRYFRPTEVDRLLGDATKARQRLGWRPKRSFADIVREMVEADIALIASEPRRFGATD